MLASLEFIQAAVARQRNKPFLKATMAASALAMLADGEVQLAERYRLDEILQRLEGLKIYDPQKAIAILDEFIHDLRSNDREAREVLLGKLARAGQDPESARVIPSVVLAICASDGVFSEGERHVFEEICAALGLNPADYEDPLKGSV
ncbi:tellurite resistance TerB family protein [Pelagibius sp.]|uniref:tellurite resistance TerB family protein n=1 Tax=Pelagibius sp. TaxID=1931238 RepID=UPI0026169A73|nr:TerB family tellurite resistance protein [Pelagibius sp.]